MAVAFIQEFPIGSRTTTNYDAIDERLSEDRPKPDGLLMHFAGFDDDAGVFRIVNVWEAREQGQAYRDEHVMPAVRAVVGESGGTPPSRDGSYELHRMYGAHDG